MAKENVSLNWVLFHGVKHGIVSGRYSILVTRMLWSIVQG